MSTPNADISPFSPPEGPDASPLDIPTQEEIRSALAQLGDRVRQTPVWRWKGRELSDLVGEEIEVFLKLELFQNGGTFKARGALLNMLRLSEAALARGVTAVSAGNHAIAVAFAARDLGTSAKVVMPSNASPARIAICRDYGAEVILKENVHQAFEETQRIEREEGRTFVHPFEGRTTALGTATLGLEFMEQVPDLDAVVVPIGGGGLCAGVANAVKSIRESCRVIGVEPEGADTMHRSFAAGEPQSIDKVRTIADSLGAPYALPYTFALCRRFVDELVKVDDDQLKAAMGLLFREMKLATEPAGAASTAALCGPLRERFTGASSKSAPPKKIGLIVCGTNIDLKNFTDWCEDPIHVEA